MELLSSRDRCLRGLRVLTKCSESPKQWTAASVLGRWWLCYRSRFCSELQRKRKLQIAALKEGLTHQEELGCFNLRSFSKAVLRRFAELSMVKSLQLVLLVKGEVFKVFCCPCTYTRFRTSARIICLYAHHSFPATPTVFAICKWAALALQYSEL